jgi:hypothetical protein
VPVAVELYFNHEADAAVRRIWTDLDSSGVASLGSVPAASYRPHVSLAAAQHVDAETLGTRLAGLQWTHLFLPLTHLGFFLSPGSVAFLGVLPSTSLLTLHSEAAAMTMEHADGYWPHYLPGTWVAHCTLAMGFTDVERVAAVLRLHELPIEAEAVEGHLVDVSTGLSVAQFF